VGAVDPALITLKVGLALGAAALFAAGIALARCGRPDAARRLRDRLGIAAAALGFLAYWNFGTFHGGRLVHWYDSFHYYVGAKYFPELGYTRLYLCTALADLEAGSGPAPSVRSLRDLETNRLTRAAPALADPARCRAHFSDARWSEFTRDVAFFREELPPGRWLEIQRDHGFNGTPVWLLAGHAIANAVPATRRSVALLSLLDAALLAAAWAAALACFGWRAALAPLVYFGTNAFGHFSWTGGAILRQDWLAACIVSLCALQRERPFAAGFALGVAALLRVFPAFAAIGLAAGAVARAIAERNAASLRAPLRFGAGAAAAAALLVPLAALTQGASAWPDFARNARIDAGTPLRNHVGLATLVAFDPSRRASALVDARAEDPFEGWKLAQQRSLAVRAPWIGVALVAYLTLLASVARALPDWAALAAGFGAIPFCTSLTAYYQTVLLGVVFLAPLAPEIGLTWCLAAAASWWAAPAFGFSDYDQLAASALILATSLFSTLRARAGRRDSSAARLIP
jgi:hypothetical protein